MSDEKVLTKEIAVQFLTDRDSVDLSDFITIDNEAARILSQVEGELDLSGLEYFADTPDHLALVEKLSQHEGGLNLDGLTELSDAAAERLGEHAGYLVLRGLTSLSDAAVESLSKHQGDLSLSGLTSLSDAAAESLSQHGDHDGNSRRADLSLNGLTSLSDAAAESLSKHGGNLDLMSLKYFSDTPDHLALVESLSQQEGVEREGQLYLNDLKSLSDAVAERLGKHAGYLTLCGLTSLSDAAAESLSKNEGYLALDGLTSLSDAAAESLSKCQDVSIDLENLPASAAQILRDAGHGV